MKKTARSFGFAVSGLVHAVRHERNLKMFLLAHLIVLAIGLSMQITIIEWLVLLVFAGMFMVVELFNTALERLADTVDDMEKDRKNGHYHPGIKMTKDVAAAAALIALLLDLVVLALVFLPRFLVLALQTR
jgi:diacylglycerol kinase